MLWCKVKFHQAVGTAFVQRADPFTFCMVHLMFETTWMSPGLCGYDGYVAGDIVIVLVPDGARDGDCVPDITLDIQLKYQGKPKRLLKGLISKGKLRSSVYTCCVNILHSSV